MSEIIVALISVVGTIIISLLGVVIAKKYNIGPNQEKIVQTYKDLLEIQDRKIGVLRDEVQESKEEIHKLRTEVDLLKALTIRQAFIIDTLQSTQKVGG